MSYVSFVPIHGTLMQLARKLCYSGVTLKFSGIACIIIRWQLLILYALQVCFMLLFSCRTYSVGGSTNSSLRSASGEELDKIMMTSSGWCETNIQCMILLGLFAVLKASVMSIQNAAWLINQFVILLDLYYLGTFCHLWVTVQCGQVCWVWTVQNWIQNKNGGSWVIVLDWQDLIWLVSHKGMIYIGEYINEFYLHFCSLSCCMAFCLVMFVKLEFRKIYMTSFQNFLDNLWWYLIWRIRQ